VLECSQGLPRLARTCTRTPSFEWACPRVPMTAWKGHPTLFRLPLLRSNDLAIPISPSSPDLSVLPNGCFRVTPSEKRQLLAEFRKEARRARSQFRESLVMEWHETYPSMGDKENQPVDRYSGTTGLSDSGFMTTNLHLTIS
jgi:hypothetical protein